MSIMHFSIRRKRKEKAIDIRGLLVMYDMKLKIVIFDTKKRICKPIVYA